MTHWFHRNPLKATAKVSFNLCGGGGASSSSSASRLCSELRTSRARLLEMFAEVDAVPPDAMRSAADVYLSLLQGLIVAVDHDDRPGASSSSSSFSNVPNDGTSRTTTRPPHRDNEMRFAQKFKWTDTLLQGCGSGGAAVFERRDAVFELASVAFNVALWHTKHAARTAAKEDATEAEAAGVHRSLRVAAGIFTHLADEQAPRLMASSTRTRVEEKNNDDNKGRDLEPRVLHAYATQCLAEAQEVTIARAVALGHEAALVAALAHNTAELYRRADAGLSSVEVAVKWRKYLQLKQSFYAAYAHCYHGQTLLAEDRCGQSIRCLRTAERCYGRAQALCRDYRQTRGPSSSTDAAVTKPSEQLFFLRLGRLIQSTLAKSQRENDFIYFHRVPAGEEPRLTLEAPSYGLAEPVAFRMPPPSSELWAAPEVYAALRLGRRARPGARSDSSARPGARSDSSKSKEDEEVRPVKEPELKPQKDTGCVVS